LRNIKNNAFGLEIYAVFAVLYRTFPLDVDLFEGNMKCTFPFDTTPATGPVPGDSSNPGVA